MRLTAKRLRSLAVLSAALLLMVLLAGLYPAGADAVDSDHLEAYFKAKFGYQETDYDQFSPTLLNYVCFSHYLSRDFGVLDDDYYALYGGVSGQMAADYIAYLNRFGYAVAFDATQNDTRYVELRDVNAPPCLPQVFRFYYFPENQALVTIESRHTEEAFDQACTDHWADYENELYYNLLLLRPGLSVSLEEVRAVNEYDWENADHPYCEGVFSGLIKSWYGPDRLEKTLADGTRLLVMNNEYADANRNQMYYWLLRLEFTSADQPFHPEDWEFCIADDGFCVYFPLQIGNRLTEREDGSLVLGMDPALFSGNTDTLWVSFPMYYNHPWDFARLYIAPAGEGVPILNRKCVGFDRPLTGENEKTIDVDWSSWSF